MTAYSYTASVVCHVGGNLVLLDCQKYSLELDYDALEVAIIEKTRAIIPVDLGGSPVIIAVSSLLLRVRKISSRSNNDMQKKLGRAAIVADAGHAFETSCIIRWLVLSQIFLILV